MMDTAVIFGLIILAIVIVAAVYEFIKLSKEKKQECLREWLRWAVTEAEKQLGGGTGALKLRCVYDMAITKFPWVATLITFKMFSDWVDEALDWMEEQSKKNANIDEYIKTK